MTYVIQVHSMTVEDCLGSDNQAHALRVGGWGV